MNAPLATENKADVIGIAEWCLDRSGTELFSRATEFGFTTVHLDYGRPGRYGCLEDPKLRANMGRAAAGNSVSISAVVVNVLNEIPIRWDSDNHAERQYCEAVNGAVAAAADLGVPLVVLPSFEAGVIHDEASIRILAHRIRAAIRGAPAFAPPLLATENSLNAEGNLYLAGLVEHPRFRILLDTQNPTLYGHDPVHLVKGLGTLLCDQVHIKDGTSGVMGNVPLGAGATDIRRTIEALVRTSSVRTWIIENEYDDVSSGVDLDVRWLRRTLHALQAL